MSAEVIEAKDHHPYVPMLEAINAAFKAVFPDERIIDVEYIPALPDRNQEIFAIRSDKMTRRYLRDDPSRSFEDILRGTPHLDKKLTD